MLSFIKWDCCEGPLERHMGQMGKAPGSGQELGQCRLNPVCKDGLVVWGKLLQVKKHVF